MAKKDVNEALKSRLQKGASEKGKAHPEARSGKSSKMNLSVYPQDWTKVNELKRYVFDRMGEGATNSEIVRTAIRLSAGTPEFITMLKNIRPEDGRRGR